jgi:cytochrome c biogenesis protein CcmG, thiol:disulfide interchange protein DsbE
MRALKFLVPLLVFVGICWFLWAGLGKDTHLLPSPLIGKRVPTDAVPILGDGGQKWSPEQMKGKVWLLNVWGSWCSGCRVEHPVLNDFSRKGIAPLVGIAWKDAPADAQKWLDRLGNPYEVSVMDVDGKVGIEWGVYGAPETFVIDKKGVIREKQVGAVTPELLQAKLIPLIRKLQEE